MKNYVVTYYENISQFYGIYHNHKETSAWGGLVLHVLFCGLIINAEIPQSYEFSIVIVISAMLIVVATVVFFYIQNQLFMKERAGALFGAAKYILAEDILPTDNQSSLKELNEYIKIVESLDMSRQSSHILPKYLLDKANIIDSRGRGYQTKTRIMMYTLLTLSTVAVILIKFASLLP